MQNDDWVKQLTRENTLLDRSLRAIAYNQSIREIGNASFSNTICVGRGRITSMYYSKSDYSHQQSIILKEFMGKYTEKIGNLIAKYLEKAYIWNNSVKIKIFSKKDFLEYMGYFNLHHAHCRGAIVYGYWGEPAITNKLKILLSNKVTDKRLDEVLSILSAPRLIDGKLTELYHPSAKVEIKKKELIKELNLNQEEIELIKILSWFTVFYELGERVSSMLYDTFLTHLKKIYNDKQFEDLEWYDPLALVEYIKGRKLSDNELKERKILYILIIYNDALKVLTGKEAQDFYDKNFKENIPKYIKEFKGTIASKGKVEGFVKVIIKQEDQQKMQNGDILVSTMTTPRLMDSVQKSAAIVTDEGGLTAHAAIVARELGIPCIVGTKIATQVYKRR